MTGKAYFIVTTWDLNAKKQKKKKTHITLDQNTEPKEERWYEVRKLENKKTLSSEGKQHKWP